MKATELIAIRERLNLTQTELGKKLGVSLRTIARLESGKQKISQTVVLALETIINRDK